ncbi:MAG: sigma-70 family RNA polymerase sigma factor [Bacteroidales bacterium]
MHEPYSDRPDEVLVEEFRRTRDPDVLGDLYARYMHLVYGVCLKYLGDREEAKDGVMQIFEKLSTDLPRFGVENFKTWLYVLSKNHCLMQLRSAKRHRARFDAYKKEEAFVESSSEMHPLDRDEGKLSRALEACIEALKEEQKACIRLFYYEKQCYQEIASTLDLEEKKVKSHLQNGKRNLKLCLEEHHVGDE